MNTPDKSWSEPIVQWGLTTFNCLPENLLKTKREFNELQSAIDANAPPEEIGSEMADVVIMLAGLAAHYGLDLASCVDSKMTINRARKWTRLPDGTYQHIKEK